VSANGLLLVGGAALRRGRGGRVLVGGRLAYRPRGAWLRRPGRGLPGLSIARPFVATPPGYGVHRSL
ncbi:MAG TPA: hypothetical protein VEZ19_11110, partial [Rubrobacter sp.]|nr:hypothetical protein [Rubrobacter sp.]